MKLKSIMITNIITFAGKIKGRFILDIELV